MATTSPSPVCPDCGSPLSPESPFALCAACLLRQALASQTRIDGGKSAPFFPPLTPEEIADRFSGFEIIECLGRGGMGVVYKARQKSLDRWVAIKIVAPEKHGEERFSGRFAREAATLAKLSHSNIVTIHDFGETDGLFYIVMEFVDGVNLRDLVSEGRLAPEQALAIVPPICDALQYAHEKGVVHRDIKPENILLDRDGRVRIADFGIAALMGGPGEPAGTPPYAAPEQTVPNATADHRADIHALGVVFYEMLTGERPSGEIIAPSKRRDTDSRLDDMVLRAMARNPADRFQTAGEFRTAVDSVGKTPPAVADGKSPRKWLLPAAALLVLGSIGYFAWPHSPPPAKADKPVVITAADTPNKKDKPLIDGSHIDLDDLKSLWEHSLNPEQAAILLERGKNEIKGESRRSNLASLVISYLCNQGYAEAAWNLISPEAGKVREAQVEAWFNSSKASLDAKMKRLERLTDPTDRENAMEFLFQGGSSVDEICALDFNNLISKSTVERQRLFVSLCRRLQDYPTLAKTSEDTTKLLRKCLNLTAEGWLDPSEAGRIFQAAGDSGSFDQWQMLEGIKWNLPKNSYERIQEAIVQNMAGEDPERAIRTLVKTIPLKQRYSMLTKVYQKMREDAPGTSVEKVRALLPEFDPGTVEQLSHCVINGAFLSGELELAKEWMPRISNAMLRKDLAEGYASALQQRKENLEKGLTNPDTTRPRPSWSR